MFCHLIVRAAFSALRVGLSSQEKNFLTIEFMLRIAGERAVHTGLPGPMCQPGDWGLPQLRTAAHYMKEVQFLCVNDSWPRMNGAGLSSVIKHFLKAHWAPGTA